MSIEGKTARRTSFGAVRFACAVTPILLFCSCETQETKTIALEDGGKVITETRGKRMMFESSVRRRSYYVPPGTETRLPLDFVVGGGGWFFRLYAYRNDQIRLMDGWAAGRAPGGQWEHLKFLDENWWPHCQLRLFVRAVSGTDYAEPPKLPKPRQPCSDKPWLFGWIPSRFDLAKGRIEFTANGTSVTTETSIGWNHTDMRSRREGGEFERPGGGAHTSATIVYSRSGGLWELDIGATRAANRSLTTIPFPQNLEASVYVVGVPSSQVWGYHHTLRASPDRFAPAFETLLALDSTELLLEEHFTLSSETTHKVNVEMLRDVSGSPLKQKPTVRGLWGDPNPRAVCVDLSGVWRLLLIDKDYAVAVDTPPKNGERGSVMILRITRKRMQGLNQRVEAEKATGSRSVIPDVRPEPPPGSSDY